ATTAGTDSGVRNTATAARVRKMSSPEPMLRVEKSESPKRRPLALMEPVGRVAASGSRSVLLMGTFLSAHGPGGGVRGHVTAVPPSPVGLGGAPSCSTR